MRTIPDTRAPTHLVLCYEALWLREKITGRGEEEHDIETAHYSRKKKHHMTKKVDE